MIIVSKIKSKTGSGDMFFILIIPLLILFLLMIGDGGDVREVYLSIENPRAIIDLFNKNINPIFTILTVIGTIILLIAVIKAHLYWIEYIRGCLFNIPKQLVLLMHFLRIILIPQEILVLWYFNSKASTYFNYIIQWINYKSIYLVFALISLFLYYAALIYVNASFNTQ